MSSSLFILALLFLILSLYPRKEGICRGNLIDSDSVLVRSVAYQWIEEANDFARQLLYKQAAELSVESFMLYPTSLAAAKAGRWFELLAASSNASEDNVEIMRKALQWYHRSLSIDKENGYHAFVFIGVQRHYMGNFTEAVSFFKKAIDINPSDTDAWFNMGVSYQHAGAIEASANAYDVCVSLDNLNARCLWNMASLHHTHGLLSQAIHNYLRAISAMAALSLRSSTSSHDSKTLKTNLGVAYMQSGMIKQAMDILVSVRDESDLELRMNPNCCYNRSCDLRLLADDNFRYVCSSLYDLRTIAVSHIFKVQRTSSDWLRWEETSMFLLRATTECIQEKKALVALLPFDTLLLPVPLASRLAIAQYASQAIRPPENPTQLSETESTFLPRSLSLSMISDSASEGGAAKALRLGFLSYDFNDHPTAHLVEGIFDVIRRCRDDEGGAEVCADVRLLELSRRIELIVFSYGKHDNSTYRLRLEELADAFIDIALLSHSNAAAVISQSHIDILLDMQLHTLGNRLQIIAGRPAPIQLNYLVYPGTSGADFIDSIVVDNRVVPPEHASMYSESLLLIPATYQISFFGRHVDKTVGLGVGWDEKYKLRREFGLPVDTGSIILCNFNKIEKLDPTTFSTWMSILRRLPTAYLWLLEPSIKRERVVDRANDPGSSSSGETQRVEYYSEVDELVAGRIRNAAEAEGVSGHRIIFAPRIGKQQHIARHRAADMFVDSFVYGAHSTATDALRGGLLVLTMQGEAFPARVGVSLYASISGSGDSSNPINLELLLVRSSMREFEDTAVALASRDASASVLPADALARLEQELQWVIRNRLGLFATERNVLAFLHAMLSLYEARINGDNTSKNRRVPHVCVSMLNLFRRST